MKKRIITMFMIIVLLLVGCGNLTNNTIRNLEVSEVEAGNISNKKSTSEEMDMTEEFNAIGNIEVEENLFDVEFTLPADLVGETTQEELDVEVAKSGCKYAVLNEDGSVTYVMTKKQHAALLEETRESFMTTLDEMPGSEGYPEMVSVEVNDKFTEYIVTTTNEELSFAESFSVLGFYMYSGLYSILEGSEIENINVKFVNEASGEVISESNSSDIESE